MSSETEVSYGAARPTDKLEIAHILFMDIVGYARLSMEKQPLIVNELQSLVHDTADFRESSAKGELMSLPRGDGMALVFFRDALAPVRCAMEIARELKSRPHIHLRMGVNTGPVILIRDINESADVSGLGIVLAQRVMDCGDEGHILLSDTVADHISKLTAWAPYVHDIGRCEVKHGQRVHLFNLYTREIGNPAHPRKVMQGYAAVIERSQKLNPKVAPTRFQSVRDGMMIFTWSCLIIGGFSAFFYIISPTFKDYVDYVLGRGRIAKERNAGLPTFPLTSTSGGDNVGLRSGGSSGVPDPLNPIQSRVKRPKKPTGSGSGGTVIDLSDSTRNPADAAKPALTVYSEAQNRVLAPVAMHPAESLEDSKTEEHTVDVKLIIPEDGLRSRYVKIGYLEQSEEGPSMLIEGQYPPNAEVSHSLSVHGPWVQIFVSYDGTQVLSGIYVVRDR